MDRAPAANLEPYPYPYPYPYLYPYPTPTPTPHQVLWTEHLQLPISRSNEEKATRDLIDRCAASLASFSGSLQVLVHPYPYPYPYPYP